MSGDFLAVMAASSRARVERAREQQSERALRGQAEASALPPRLQLSPRGFDVIAEVKLRSPAAGALQTGDDNLAERVGDYAAAGAAAVSVLTEPSRFDGSMRHLQLAAQSLGRQCPAMRKDFLVDPYQVIEARVAGAGGVLVILRMLPVEQTTALLVTAAEFGLFVLLEAFDERDLELAAQLVQSHQAAAQAAQAPLLVGVNCRDLVSLQVLPERFESLAAQLPVGVPRVAESGMESPADVRRVAAAGYDVALIGSALMRTPDPPRLLGELLHAGRAGAAA